MSDETTSEETSETTGEDELHRKFREALQQKTGRGKRSGPVDAEDGKVVGHAAAAHKKRQFRRKSG